LIYSSLFKLTLICEFSPVNWARVVDNEPRLNAFLVEDVLTDGQNKHPFAVLEVGAADDALFNGGSPLLSQAFPHLAKLHDFGALWQLPVEVALSSLLGRFQRCQSSKLSDQVRL